MTFADEICEMAETETTYITEHYHIHQRNYLDNNQSQKLEWTENYQFGLGIEGRRDVIKTKDLSSAIERNAFAIDVPSSTL